ncbi:MAG: hypothetical protein M4579_005639 [Chaenotheca gracillima]|nr:MAG: hypothetical protein M4579_005639 [Chaenotheca gracillima]
MRVICPLSACASYEKRDKFFNLLSDIAKVTIQSEPRNHGYCWFESAGDNTEVPNYWVRGFEVYEDEDALDVHRDSEPYKKMRAAFASDSILSKTTDIRFLQPTGLGFFRRTEEQVRFTKDKSLTDDTKNLIVTWDIKPQEDKQADVRKDLEQLAKHVEGNEPSAGTFWVLEYLPEFQDSTIIIFSRFANTEAYNKHANTPIVKEIGVRLESNCHSVRTTRWKENGIGFIGR